jgi:hypothetical protein
MAEQSAQARRAKIVEMERVRDPGVAWRDLFGNRMSIISPPTSRSSSPRHAHPSEQW